MNAKEMHGMMMKIDIIKFYEILRNNRMEFLAKIAIMMYNAIDECFIRRINANIRKTMM